MTPENTTPATPPPFDDFEVVTEVQEEEQRRKALENTRIGTQAGSTPEGIAAENKNLLNGEEIVRTTLGSNTSEKPVAKPKTIAKEN